MILCVDELHREEVPPIDLPYVVYPTDIGVRKLPCNPHLGEKPLAAHGVLGKPRRKKFQGNGLAQLEVVGSIDLARSTAAQQANDAVTVGKNSSGSESSGGDGVG